VRSTRTIRHAGQDRLEPPPLSSTNPAADALVRGLAEAFLNGTWDLDGLIDRGGHVLGRRYRWLRPLARRVLASFADGPRPRMARLALFLQADEGFRKARRRYELALHLIVWPAPPMTPAPGPPERWPVPSIVTLAELARFLDVEPSELDWFADCQGRERTTRSEQLRHDRYRWVAKSSGSLRLIEAPKPRLKRIQRRLLDTIGAAFMLSDYRGKAVVLTFSGNWCGRCRAMHAHERGLANPRGSVAVS